MRVYLAGPMSARPRFNAEGFAAAEAYALSQGWAVANPQHVDPRHDGPCPPGERQTTAMGSHPYGCWMRASLRMMLGCDAILLLPGWRDSRGARLEHRVAVTCGMDVREMAS